MERGGRGPSEVRESEATRRKFVREKIRELKIKSTALVELCFVYAFVERGGMVGEMI